MGIRFLHAADLHLDTPFKGVTHIPKEQLEALRESTFQAFTTFIQYALETQPDFIVIVGDIYDGAYRSLRAQVKFQEGMHVLAEAHIPVFLSYGNHDHLKGTWTRFDLPNNVRVFPEEVMEERLTVRGERVSLYGFSYPTQHVKERMIDAYPVADADGIHIGLLHGSVDGDATHAVYAPFTKEALISKRYHYWALGHIHKRQALYEDPPIVYPGNTQGRHRNEQGIKGFYDVTLEKGQVTRAFIPSSSIVFETLTVSCIDIVHAGDLLEKCEEVIQSYQDKYDVAVIVTLKMIEIDERAAALLRGETEEEWLIVIREVMLRKSPFVWVNELIYEYSFTENEEVELMMAPVRAMMDDWTSDQWMDVLQDVYQHTRSIPYLEQLTEDDFEAIKSATEQQLLVELNKRR